jgi:hypothetical protein
MRKIRAMDRLKIVTIMKAYMTKLINWKKNLCTLMSKRLKRSLLLPKLLGKKISSRKSALNCKNKWLILKRIDLLLVRIKLFLLYKYIRVFN